MEDSSNNPEPASISPDPSEPVKSPVVEIQPEPITAPAPEEPEKPMAHVTAVTPTDDWKPAPRSTSGSMFGRLSLVLGVIGLGLFVVLIFMPKLISSLNMAYVWWSILALLGAGGLVLGALGQRKRETVDVVGLVGMVLAGAVFVQCMITGASYVKLRMAIEDFQKSFSNSLNTSFDNLESSEIKLPSDSSNIQFEVSNPTE